MPSKESGVPSRARKKRDRELFEYIRKYVLKVHEFKRDQRKEFRSWVRKKCNV